MKKILFSFLLLFVSYLGFSQKGLSYQVVILDPNKIEIPGQDISGQPFVNGDVWLKFSIYDGSNLQFEEVQKTKTDAYGLVSLMIGGVSTASFNSLIWDTSQKSLQVHVSFDQGGSFTKISDQKLTYNPYALFAETAGKLGGTLAISGGGTGATTMMDARLNFGLDQVNNTSDAAKPVSTATKAALDLKANSADMVSALALKANTSEVNASLALKANTTEVISGLASKADTGIIRTYIDAKVAAATIADADANTKGKIQIAGDLSGTAAAPTVPALALKTNVTDFNAFTTQVASTTASLTANLAAETNRANAADVVLDTKINATTASLTASLATETARAQAAELALTNNVAANTASINSLVPVAFSGNYADLSNTPTAVTASTLSGTVSVANGGTGLTSTPANGQIDIGNGTGFTRATLTPGTGIVITNTAGVITISAFVRQVRDQRIATAGATSFTLSQTPGTDSQVVMYVNGIRTNNSAYSWSGTTLTYVPASNNNYVLAANDRIQFDYYY